MDEFGRISDTDFFANLIDVFGEEEGMAYVEAYSEGGYYISSEEEETEGDSELTSSGSSETRSVIEMEDTQPIIIGNLRSRRRTGNNPVSDEDEDDGGGSPVIEIIDNDAETTAPILNPANANFIEVETGVHNGENMSINSTPRKRKLSSDGNSGTPKKNCLPSQDDDCPICFDSWTNSGKHRLSSLKCGHLFGHSCVLRWLKQGERKCPQCNLKAKISDIRILYAKRLTAIDNSELERATINLEEEKKKRRECEMQLAQFRMKYQMMQSECDQLKLTLEDLKQRNKRLNLSTSGHSETSNAVAGKGYYKLCKCFTASNTGNCRVMDYSEFSNTIAFSQPSPHNNFMAGFGIKKLSAADLKSNTFIFLHSKQIKDVKFRPGSTNWVMSASQDSTIKITNLDSQSVIQTFNLKKNVWSCCWDQANTNYLYAGLSTGAMALYDIRKTNEAVGLFQHEGYRCPIVSMYHVPSKLQQGATMAEKGGLLVSTLKGVAFWRQENCDDSFDLTPNLLPISNGICAGMCYSSKLDQILVTYRPGKHPGSKTSHNLYNVNFFPRQSAGEIICNFQHLYPGGTSHSILNRNALYNIGNESFVAFGNEINKTIVIHDTNTNKLRATYKCDYPSMDIKSIKVNNTYLLTTLTDKNLRVYEYVC